MDVWKIAGDAAGEACLPVWLARRRPDPQDSLSETDEASGEEEGHSDQYLLDQQFESTNPGVAPTHAVQMINLPYIFAELNTETKRRRRFGCGINTVCPRIVSSDDILGCEVLSLFFRSRMCCYADPRE